MIINFDQFTKAAEEVDRILKLPLVPDLEQEIKKSGENVTSENKREFYRHMNSLFLNVLLNRLNELGETAETRAIEARKIIYNIIKSL